MADYMAAVARSAFLMPDGAEQTYLIIQPEHDGVHLVVYADNVFNGDSWHDSAADAQTRAAEDYGIFLSDWCGLPTAQTCDEALAVIRSMDNL